MDKLYSEGNRKLKEISKRSRIYIKTILPEFNFNALINVKKKGVRKWIQKYSARLVTACM